ncbi:MerR family transcriptional regulator [Acinetobacter kyonggiensis]|uniref:DNA-binding transcriptional regulator, MerR family n=1 Tax=Acinetobacter kyonggiensis TaxID=595670 RepID=A0A1H3LF73_9GAMM|nr:MerR family transcriptional regulator [Acinetobacter kyonggiensis]SDY63197.1 DNA-binding transcriptional regulator, MerR family [Acinetobacter kyonggiensis]
MYIGKLALVTGVTQKAIRHYENLGLIPAPERKGNYRFYKQLDIQLIKMIKQAQAVGFSLSEIATLAEIKAQEKRFPLEIAQQLLKDKQLQILQKKAELERIEKDLLFLEQELTEMYGAEKTS